jgi:hypothetical protein
MFMADTPARRERQDAVLAELSELGLTLARDLHARALAAETPQEADRLALAFQRVSRGVRQTFALELKIERARRVAEREDAQAAAEAQRAAVQAAREAEPSFMQQRDTPTDRRKSRVRNALTRLIWQEAEGDEDEIEILDADLETRLYEASLREDFLDLPIETVIRQLKSDMGLSGELRITACDAPPSPNPPPPDASDPVFDAAPPNTG